MKSNLYQDRINIEPESNWYQFNFNRVFFACCITLLVLLAYMSQDLPGHAIQAAAGLS